MPRHPALRAWRIVSWRSPSRVIGLESFGGNLYAIGGGSTTAASTRIQQVGSGLPIADEATVTNASWASGVATITANNNFTAGQSVAVAGITTATGYNGTFTVVSASSTQFTYALTTEPTGTPGFAAATASVQAVVTQVPGIPVNTSTQAVPVFFPVDAYLTHLGSTGTALDTIYIADDGKSFGAGAITKWSLVNDNISTITESGTTATVTLSAASLGLIAGENVNITIAGEVPTAYNGTFSVTVVTPTSFTFTAPASTGSDTTHGTASGFVENGAISYSDTVQQLGFYWLAGATNTSTDAVTLYSTYGNGGNADFGPGITYSVTDADGYNAAPGVPITAASWASTNGGTVTITAANTFQAGQFVTITGITPNGYNGLYTILTANSSSFTYALSSNPGSASVSGSYAVSLSTVNTVTFEGVGGDYAGNEVTRGVALAPQAMTNTLVDNGPNPSTPAQAITLTITVASSGSVNVPTGTVTLVDASTGNTVVGSGTLQPTTIYS